MQADDLSSAQLTYTDKFGYPDLNGYIHLMGRGHFEIDNCGEGCHLLLKINETMAALRDPGLYKNISREEDKASERGLDRTTMTSISVIVYYTPKFSETHGDVEGIIDNVVNIANTVCRNSQVPITFKLHCIQPLDISENLGAVNRIHAPPAPLWHD